MQRKMQPKVPMLVSEESTKALRRGRLSLEKTSFQHQLWPEKANARWHWWQSGILLLPPSHVFSVVIKVCCSRTFLLVAALSECPRCEVDGQHPPILLGLHSRKNEIPWTEAKLWSLVQLPRLRPVHIPETTRLKGVLGPLEEEIYNSAMCSQAFPKGIHSHLLGWL